MTEVTFSLSDDQIAFLADLVEQGEFVSVGAAIQAGLELLRKQFEEVQDESVINAEEFARLFGEMIETKRREYGIPPKDVM